MSKNWDELADAVTDILDYAQRDIYELHSLAENQEEKDEADQAVAELDRVYDILGIEHG